MELFLRATEGTAVSSPRDGEEDVDNPNNRAFWHKTVFTERLNKTVGRTIRLKQGFIRCHDDILKELTSISQARVHPRLYLVSALFVFSHGQRSCNGQQCSNMYTAARCRLLWFALSSVVLHCQT